MVEKEKNNGVVATSRKKAGVCHFPPSIPNQPDLLNIDIKENIYVQCRFKSINSVNKIMSVIICSKIKIKWMLFVSLNVLM